MKQGQSGGRAKFRTDQKIAVARHEVQRLVLTHRTQCLGQQTFEIMIRMLQRVVAGPQFQDVAEQEGRGDGHAEQGQAES